MLSLALVIVVFLTVVMAVFAFGAAVVTPTSVLGARLRALGGQQQPSRTNLPCGNASSRRWIRSARRFHFLRQMFRVPAPG